jgi:ribosomal protein S27AE
MNCPNCGAGSYQDNRGRWICSNHCGWETGISPGLGGSYELSELRRSNLAGAGRGWSCGNCGWASGARLPRG